MSSQSLSCLARHFLWYFTHPLSFASSKTLLRFSHTSSLPSASISPLPSPHPRLFFALPPSPRWVSPNKVDCSQRTTGSVTASLTAKLLPAGSEGGRRRLLVCGLACPMACPISARTALIDHAARPHVPRPVGDTEPCLCWADS